MPPNIVILLPELAPKTRTDNGEWRRSHDVPYGPDGDASQHTEAALTRLLELEQRWPHYLERLSGGPYEVPKSVDELREKMERRFQEDESKQRK